MDTTSPPQSTVAAGRLLSFDLAEARASFGQAPFPLRHELTGSPLFAQDALAELADRLPRDEVEHNLGSVGAVVPDGEVPQLDSSPGEIVRGIETNGSWIVLPDIQRVSGYREVFEALMDELAVLVPGGRDAMSGYHSAVFMAAPGSTTPSHIDPELGFLLHLRGDKRVSLGRFPDPETERVQVEGFHHGGHRNTKDLPVEARRFDLASGDGVHVPPFKPHWVENGDTVAVSVNVGFQTPANLRRRGVYMWNARVRRFGVSPSPPGVRPGLDRVKAGAIWSAVHARRRVLRRG